MSKFKMGSIPQTDLWCDFFAAYRRLPALWNVTDEVYKNKRQKAAAYNKLLSYYVKIHPEANVDSMRRRMNGIRTCYRRELRKVQLSELRAKNPKEVHEPHLWYFKELSFLRDIPTRDVSYASPEETSDSFFNNEESEEDEQMEESKDDVIILEEPKIEPNLEEDRETSPNITRPEAIRTPLDQSLNNSQMFPPLLQNLNQSSRDEASIFAEGWAISYRKLDERNRLLAKKAIEEILVLGQLNQLEFNSVKMPQ